MKRTVILPVDDRVTHLAIEHQDDTMLGGGNEDGDLWPDLVKAERVPVPPDDQLTRDLDEVTHALKKRTGLSPEREDMALLDACRRVRAAAGLDENE